MDARKGSKIVKTVLLLAMLVIALSAWWFYAGGYWENLPHLDRISGPKRFRQFVCNPIPPDVFEIRGGYSGFPQGLLKTTFSYSGQFSPEICNPGWEMMDLPALPHDVWNLVNRPDITRSFGLNCNQTQSVVICRCYLLLDDRSSVGCIVMP